MKTLRILGIRGIPAAHGGFETFAEYLAIHLVSLGWRVVVYCQENGVGQVSMDLWQGVERIHIPIKGDGAKSTILFDWKSISHAAKYGDLCLTLGYNTAIFCSVLRLKGVTNLINMDGIEWARKKWGWIAKLWFWINDWLGCIVGDHLIADHPQIFAHLNSRVSAIKITMIPYGAEPIYINSLPSLESLGYGLESCRYWTLIARPEPENSLLEIVQGFSCKKRGIQMVVLGELKNDDAYHRKVIAAASNEVIFLGAIYDKKIVQTLRVNSIGYVHGHQVGGTNPSLVEALGAGNAIIAYKNKFNFWVAGEAAVYFSGAAEFSLKLDELGESSERLQVMRKKAIERFQDEFTWKHILEQYEKLLTDHLK